MLLYTDDELLTNIVIFLQAHANMVQQVACVRGVRSRLSPKEVDPGVRDWMLLVGCWRRGRVDRFSKLASAEQGQVVPRSGLPQSQSRKHRFSSTPAPCARSSPAEIPNDPPLLPAIPNLAPTRAKPAQLGSKLRRIWPNSAVETAPKLVGHGAHLVERFARSRPRLSIDRPRLGRNLPKFGRHRPALAETTPHLIELDPKPQPRSARSKTSQICPMPARTRLNSLQFSWTPLHVVKLATRCVELGSQLAERSTNFIRGPHRTDLAERMHHMILLNPARIWPAPPKSPPSPAMRWLKPNEPKLFIIPPIVS